MKEKYYEILKYNCEILKITEETLILSKTYINRNILSERFSDDCMHIAIATINKIDLLVSWNFRHIVHYDKIRMFNGVNIELGYKPIEIYSPREVTTHEKD